MVVIVALEEAGGELPAEVEVEAGQKHELGSIAEKLEQIEVVYSR